MRKRKWKKGFQKKKGELKNERVETEGRNW